MIRFRILIPLLVLLIAVPAAVASAAPSPKSKAKNGKRANLTAKHNGLRRGAKGGIDPASFPVVDDDFMLMTTWTSYQTRAAIAQRQSRGGGVLIAVLDGGFNLEHPDIAPNLFPFSYDALDHDLDAHDPGNGFDDDADGVPDRAGGHGTFVIGMILQVAPDAVILPIRVRDDEGWGTNVDVMEGLAFARMMQAQVVNLSVSSSWEDPAPVRRVIQEMHAEGAAVVVSAGNEGRSVVDALAVGPASIAVAAVDFADRLALFSNHSWSPDDNVVAAPGVDLYGPLSYFGWFVNGYWSGTSFAAGLVSGGLALARAASPGRPVEALYRDLLDSTDPAWSRYGWQLPFGRINLARFIEAVK
jgi:thermitase